MVLKKDKLTNIYFGKKIIYKYVLKYILLY